MASRAFAANQGLFVAPLQYQPSSDDLQTPQSQLENPLDDTESRSTLSVAMDPAPALTAMDAANLAREVDKIKQSLHLTGPQANPKSHKRSSSGYAAYVFTRFRKQDGEVTEVEKSLDALKSSILTLGNQQQQQPPLRKRPSLLSRRNTSSDAVRLGTVNEDSQLSPPRPIVQQSGLDLSKRIVELEIEVQALRSSKEEADAEVFSLHRSAREQENAYAAKLTERDGTINLHLKRHQEETAALQKLLDQVRAEKEESAADHEERFSSLRQAHRSELENVAKSREQLRSSHAIAFEKFKAHSHSQLEELERQVEAIAASKKRDSLELSETHRSMLASVQQDHERVVNDLKDRLTASEAHMREAQVAFEQRLESVKEDAQKSSAVSVKEIQGEIEEFRASHDKLIADKDQKLLSLTNRVQSLTADINEVKANANEEVRLATAEHQNKLGDMRGSHAQIMSEKEVEHQNTLENMRGSHAQIMSEKEVEHQNMLEDVSKSHAQIMSEKEAELRDLVARIEHGEVALKDSNMAAQAAKQELEAATEASRAHETQLKSALEEHTAELAKKSMQINELQTTCQTTATELEDAKRDHAKHLESLESLHASTLREHVDTSSTNNEEHQRALSAWMETAEKRQSEMAELKKTHEQAMIELEEKSRSIAKKHDEVQQEAGELRESIAELEIELSDKDREQANALKVLEEEHQAALRQRDEEIVALHQKFEDLRADMDSGEHDAQNLTKDSVCQMRELHQAELDKKDHALSDAIQSHEDRIEQLTQAHKNKIQEWERSVLQQLQAVQKQNDGRLQEIQAEAGEKAASATRQLQAENTSLREKQSVLERTLAKLQNQVEAQSSRAVPFPGSVIPANTSRTRSPPPFEEDGLRSEHLSRQLDDTLEEKRALERQYTTAQSEISSLKSRLTELEANFRTLERQKETSSNQLFAIRQKLREAEEREARLEKGMEDAVRRERHAERARDALLARSSSLTPREGSLRRPGTGESAASTSLEAAFVTPDKVTKDLRALNESLLNSLNDLRERHQRTQIQLMELRGTGTPQRSQSLRSPVFNSYPPKKDLEAAKQRILAEYKGKLDAVVREKAALDSDIQTTFDRSISTARKQIRKDVEAHKASSPRVVITDSVVSRPTFHNETEAEDASTKVQELVDEYGAKMGELFDQKRRTYPASLSMDASEVGELVELRHRAASNASSIDSPTSTYSTWQQSGGGRSRIGSQRRSVLQSVEESRMSGGSPSERRRMPHRHLESEWERQHRSSPPEPSDEDDVFVDFDEQTGAGLLEAQTAITGTSILVGHDDPEPKSKRATVKSPYGVRSKDARHNKTVNSRGKERMYLYETEQGEPLKQLETSIAELNGELAKSRWANNAVEVIGNSKLDRQKSSGGSSGRRVSKESRRDNEDEAWWSRG